MSRGKRPKSSPRSVPSRSHVVRAVSTEFAVGDQDAVLFALERMIPLEHGSLEYLQLEIVAMSRGRVDLFNELVEMAIADVRFTHQKFLTERPFCGWPEGWWSKLSA